MIPTVYHNLAGTLPEQLAHLRQDLARQPAAPGRAGLTPAEVARIRALKPRRAIATRRAPALWPLRWGCRAAPSMTCAPGAATRICHDCANHRPGDLAPLASGPRWAVRRDAQCVDVADPDVARDVGGSVMLRDFILEIRIGLARRLMVWHAEQRDAQLKRFYQLHRMRSRGQVARMERDRGIN